MGMFSRGIDIGGVPSQTLWTGPPLPPATSPHRTKPFGILKVVTWAYTSINVLDSAKAFCLFDI